MTLASLLAETGQSETVLIVTLIAGHVVTIAGLIIKFFVDKNNREQDRLDAKAEAELLREKVADQARLAAAKGEERAERIIAKVDENTQVNLKQIDISNGHNEKIKLAVETVAEVARVVALSPPATQQLHVTNDPQEIHVTVERQ